MASQKNLSSIFGGVICVVVFGSILFANYWVNKEVEVIMKSPAPVVVKAAPVIPKASRKITHQPHYQEVAVKEEKISQEIPVQKTALKEKKPVKKIYEIPLDDLILVQ
jgi:hypothetical protein